MKLARFRHLDSAAEAIAVVEEEELLVVSGRTSLTGPADLADVIDEIRVARATESWDRVPLSDAELLAPLEPPTFRDFYAFEDHVRVGRRWRGLEMDPDWYELPVFYFSNPYAVGGAGEVPRPPGTERFDFELEVGAVVGRGGRNLTPEQGEEAIVGYVIVNDWSARDVQMREMRLSMGPVKGKDTATSIGPYLVTKDELEPCRTATGFDRTMTASVNGVEYSRANWSEVYWSFGEMVSYASRGTEVRSGDLLGSGTAGTGCILELSSEHGIDRYPFLQTGDEVVFEIEGLGRLVNTVGAGDPLIELRPGSDGRAG